MNTIVWMMGVLAMGISAGFAYLYAISWIESRQARKLANKLPYPSGLASESRTAVVYFSRSGNTALAARHVARRHNAQLFTLEAAGNRIGLIGLLLALTGANRRRSTPGFLPEITSHAIDLTPFDTVWLGSPVWLYSPAPPIWAFIEHQRFDGQHVVLFNTFNSHIGEDHINRFREMVLARGAKSFEHRHVLRGRMTRQLTPEAMLHAMDVQWYEPQDN